jgi:hypothetical protein
MAIESQAFVTCHRKDKKVLVGFEPKDEFAKHRI